MTKYGWALGIVLLTVGIANADGATAKLRACHSTCMAIADECEFVNDLDTCMDERQVCKAACNDEMPAVAICIEQCEGLQQFCRGTGASRATCALESQACESRCNQPQYSRLN